VNNLGYEGSLDTRKVYASIPDRTAAAHQQLRVIDESGEDYLYPSTCFSPIRLPSETREKMIMAYA
jgi:hypothetical protein